MGLDRSYQSDNNLYIYNKTLFISGTHSARDVITDLAIPFHLLNKTQRYKDAENILENNPQVNVIVGHSLGSAIGHILSDRGQIKASRLYGSPTLFNHPKIINFRHYGDPVSLSNRVGASSETNAYFGNPHSYNGFKTFYN